MNDDANSSFYIATDIPAGVTISAYRRGRGRRRRFAFLRRR